MTKLERFLYAFALIAGVSGVAFLSIFIGDRKNSKDSSSVLLQPILKQISTKRNKKDLDVYTKDVDKFFDSYISMVHKDDVAGRKLEKAFGKSELATFNNEDSLLAYLTAEESKIPFTQENENALSEKQKESKFSKSILKDTHVDSVATKSGLLPVVLEENLPLLKSLPSYKGKSTGKTISNSSTSLEETAIKNKVYYSKYKVKPGDSVWKISKKFGFSIKAFYRVNPSLKGKVLKAGKIVKIYTHPDLSKSKPKKNRLKKNKRGTRNKKKYYFQKYKVRKRDTVSGIAKKFKTTVSKIVKWNKLRSPKIRPGQRIKVPKIFRVKKKRTHKIIRVRMFGWPVKGRVTSRFGYRRDPFNSRRRQLHAGIDFGGGMRKPIHSSADGVVIFAGRNGGYGNTVIIRHQYGYLTLYAHMSKILTKKDAIVKKGKLIGLIGRTGICTAAHLHFEIRKWKRPINPIYMIGKRLKIKVPLKKKRKMKKISA